MNIVSRVYNKIKLSFSEVNKEIERLKAIPRFSDCETSLLGGMHLADSISFIAGFEEIFVNQNYLFKSETDSPFIIDCGSNIGISIVYFKKLYPKAQIIGFEPDPNIFNKLSRNIEEKQMSGVQLLNVAIAGEAGSLHFQMEGGFSGRLVQDDSKQNLIRVKAETLSGYIDRKVDFLKIDIEGNEYDVLCEIQPKLHLVEKMFVEYHSEFNKAQNIDKLLSLLIENGFRLHIKAAYAVPHPFVEIPLMANMDNQLEIYAFR